ncbi:MAG: choline dehydrogenase [Alphaproteobacteria bacterium]|nr:choline dehydrogenase [Alphaproteobacteria bacterium]
MTEADVVIVGGGSAGCALAGRLSEDPKIQVFLLEAGPSDTDPWIRLPVGYFRNILSPLSWGFETEPDAGINGRSIVWPRGKVLGGSSSINGLIYIRGQSEDYDHWRQLGNAGWSFSDVLPYFMRAEDQERGASELHGSGGPLGVSDLRLRHPLCEAFINAAIEAGYPLNQDFNGKSQDGVGYYQLTTRNGVRSSAAAAYLGPAKRRPNLRIETDALATRVLVENGRAVGVAYLKHGIPYEARAHREVLLAGGAVNSPQLLQLSGIGPAALLKQHGVAVVHDLPGVGENLQDHYLARVIWRCTRPITHNESHHSLWRQAKIGAEWLFKRSGAATIGAGEAGLFCKSAPEVATADLQYHFMPVSFERSADGSRVQIHDFPGFNNTLNQSRPESRGWIRLKSGDPRQHPAIQANYLSADYDRRAIVAGIRIARRISEMPAMRPYVAGELSPGKDVVADDEILDYARATGGTIYHPVGTCKMGPATDRLAVVDPELRVHGIEGLRVADASIMPTLVSGNTNAAAIMIGEKAADLVRVAMT